MPHRAPHHNDDTDTVGPPKRASTEYAESRRLERKMFAQRLYRLMIAKGWNQAELSRQTKVHDPRDGQPGIGRDMIGGYIRALHLPEPPYVKILAATFGVEPEALLPTVAEAPGERAAEALAPPPALEMRSTSPGMVMLHINLEVPFATAVEALAVVQRAGGGGAA